MLLDRSLHDFPVALQLLGGRPKRQTILRDFLQHDILPPHEREHEQVELHVELRVPSN